LQGNYNKIKAAGAELIAISSDNVNATKTTVQNEGLKYPVLADKDREAITAYNVVDPGNNRIARASSFVLKQDGTVAWVSIDAWNARVPTAKILTELGKL
jgi:peroxiredoxin